MKKKIIVALLACTMLSLTACGDKKEDTTENTTETTVSEETPETTTAASVDDSFYTTDVDLSVDGEPEVANPVIETDAIAIGEYKGIEIDKVEVAAVTDEEVQAEFDSYMAAFNEEVEVTDRDTLENGDIADIDYVGKINGEEFDGGSSEGYKLELGSGTFIEGFEEGLVGVKKGETKSLALTFPEDYGNTEYAGKDVVFDVTVNGIYKTQEPEVTDEFVKENTEFESIEAYKADIRSSMEESNESTATNEKRNAIWSAVLSNCAIKKYDEQEVKDYILEYKTYVDNMVTSSYGMTFDQYLEACGLGVEDFKETAVTNAKAAAKEQLILDSIAEKEGITVSDEEYQEYLNDYMEGMGVTTEDELWTQFESQGYVKEDVVKSMKDTICANKVMEFLEANVVEK
jgi:trigger factor